MRVNVEDHVLIRSLLVASDINTVKIQINYNNTRIPQLSNMETHITICKIESQWRFSDDSRNSN